MNVPVARKAKVVFVTADSRKQEILNSGEKHFKTLAGISSMAVQSDKAGIADDAVTAVIEGVEIYLPLKTLSTWTGKLRDWKRRGTTFKRTRQGGWHAEQ